MSVCHLASIRQLQCIRCCVEPVSCGQTCIPCANKATCERRCGWLSCGMHSATVQSGITDPDGPAGVGCWRSTAQSCSEGGQALTSLVGFSNLKPLWKRLQRHRDCANTAQPARASTPVAADEPPPRIHSVFLLLLEALGLSVPRLTYMHACMSLRCSGIAAFQPVCVSVAVSSRQKKAEAKSKEPSSNKYPPRGISRECSRGAASEPG